MIILVRAERFVFWFLAASGDDVCISVNAIAELLATAVCDAAAADDVWRRRTTTVVRGDGRRRLRWLEIIILFYYRPNSLALSIGSNYGAAYFVLQWAIYSIYNQWLDIYKKYTYHFFYNQILRLFSFFYEPEIFYEYIFK